MATQVEIARPKARARGMFRALSHRNYRLFWTGAVLSNIGTWMQTVAQGWLVLQLTNSPFWLGVDGFMATVPGLVLTLVGGVFADLVDRRRLLMLTQIGAGLSALILAVLVAADLVRIWMILVLSFVTGCCMALASPSFQAITIDLVGREDLANAIALNSTQFQLSRVIGPVFAGVALRAIGIAGCFFANALSFLAVVGALLMVRFEEAAGKATARSVRDGRALWRDLVNGFRYVRTRPRVFTLIMISAVMSLLGTPYISLAPAFARDVLGFGETGLSVMMGTAGAGAFCGALLLAYLGDFNRKGWYVLCGAGAYALFYLGLSFSTRPELALAMLFGMGFSITSCAAAINTLLQQLVTDRMRGRVMSMFVLSFLGTMPVSNLIFGAAAERFGVARSFTAGSLLIAVFVITVGIRNKRLREI
jgi:MFS family permease